MHDKPTLKRELKPSIDYLLARFPVVAVVGARQVGKTTLCRLVRGNWKLYDLESEEDFQIIKRDPNFFLEQNPRHIIIDEAQELPSLFPALRVAIDQSRNESGRYIITGSSSPHLLSNVSESLAGRVAIVELLTLKSTEVYRCSPSLFYKAIEDDLNRAKMETLEPVILEENLLESWLRGGYPQAILSSEKKAFLLWMENYRQTYIQRDIRKLFPNLQFESFRTFISMLARLSGTIINYSDLARSLSVSQPTARQYIEIVHSTFVWRKLEPYTKNVTKRITKMPRGHLRDSGLLHYLLNISSHENLMRDPIFGRSWESFVIEEILKGMQSSLIPYVPCYYRTQHGAEIDLILEGHFGTLPIEVKYGVTLDHRSLRSLKDFIEEHSLNLGIVINNSKRIQWLSEKILQLPVTVI